MSYLENFKNDEKLRKHLADAVDTLALICAEAAQSKGFHEADEKLLSIVQEHAPELSVHLGNQLLQAELARQGSEIGEAVEAVRKPGADHHLPKLSNFEVEQADTVVRVMDTCGKRSISIGTAVVEKILYSLTRERLHGKNS